MTSIRRAAATAALALTLGATLGVPTASAATEAAWADDYFSLCVPDDVNGCVAHTSGWITWGNRTAGINGSVTNGYSTGYVTAIFEAYSGTVKIDSDTRTVYSGTRDFPITLGDPDRVGGFDRTKFTICWNGTSDKVCSRPQNHWRD
jgi:hypothetical protein